MRLKLLTLITLVSLSAIADPPSKIGLAWDLKPDFVTSNATIRIYSSTNITVPLKQWTVLTNVPATTNLIYIPVVPGKAFYSATYSNFWGESDFSNVASTPPLFRSDEAGLRVEKGD